MDLSHKSKDFKLAFHYYVGLADGVRLTIKSKARGRDALETAQIAIYKIANREKFSKEEFAFIKNELKL